MSDSPLLLDRLVARPELLRRLKQGRTIRLTLIVAPAGYGKTTLLDQWLQAEAASLSYLRQTPSGLAPTLTYTPALNFEGLDRLTFTVSDGLHESSPAEGDRYRADQPRA